MVTHQSLLFFGALLGGGALAFVGCAGNQRPAVAYGPDMNDSREEEIRELASRELNCPQDQLSYSSVGGSVHRESGCGRVADFVLVCPGFCFPASVQELRKRAAYELNCQQPLNIVELQKNTFGVEGCGQRATYILLYSMSTRGPQWLMNSAAIPLASPAAEPVTAPPAPAPAPAEASAAAPAS